MSGVVWRHPSEVKVGDTVHAVRSPGSRTDFTGVKITGVINGRVNPEAFTFWAAELHIDVHESEAELLIGSDY